MLVDSEDAKIDSGRRRLVLGGRAGTRRSDMGSTLTVGNGIRLRS